MTHEFICAECRNHIAQAFEINPGSRLCMTCIHIPGWFNDPKLRSMYGPEGLAVVPNEIRKPKTPPLRRVAKGADDGIGDVGCLMMIVALIVIVGILSAWPV